MTEKKGFKKIDDLGDTGRLVAMNIKRLRLGLNLTYAALEKRLEAVGNKIPELGLRRIEAEARRVDADDLTALAVALEVSPLTLLMPEDGDFEPVRISGVLDEVGSNVLWKWGLCEEPLQLPVEPIAGAQYDTRNVRAMQAFSLRAKPEILQRAAGMAVISAINLSAEEISSSLHEAMTTSTNLQNPTICFDVQKQPNADNA